MPMGWHFSNDSSQSTTIHNLQANALAGQPQQSKHKKRE